MNLHNTYAQIQRELKPYGPNPSRTEYAAVFSNYVKTPKDTLYLLICLGIGSGTITEDTAKNFNGWSERKVASELCSLLEDIISPEALGALIWLIDGMKGRN